MDVFFLRPFELGMSFLQEKKMGKDKTSCFQTSTAKENERIKKIKPNKTKRLFSIIKDKFAMYELGEATSLSHHQTSAAHQNWPSGLTSGWERKEAFVPTSGDQ